jgi:glutathione S-transferase
MPMNAPAKIRLYELELDNGRVASPFVWRIRYALAHKGLPFEAATVGFSDIPSICGGRFKTVPVIEYGATAMDESWDIVAFLDREFPLRPLFHSPSEFAMVRLNDAWFSAEILRRLFRIYVLDVHNAARQQDRTFFRQRNEMRLKGMTLEAATADRAKRLPEVRDALWPLRAQLKRFPYMGGKEPNYADYIVLGAFIWVSSVATLPLLAADDALRAYIERGFDLYGGLARDARMRPLFEERA